MTHPHDAKHAESSDTDRESTEVSDAIDQSDGQGRMPYEAPRMSTGDIFERIVMSSHADPNVEDC